MRVLALAYHSNIALRSNRINSRQNSASSQLLKVDESQWKVVKHERKLPRSFVVSQVYNCDSLICFIFLSRIQERRKQLEAERQARLEEMKQKRQDQVWI